MRRQPGDRQIEDGRAFKAQAGSSPNGVANAWLAERRGSMVHVSCGDNQPTYGKLVAFDSYSLVLGIDDYSVLIFKGPGVVVIPG